MSWRRFGRLPIRCVAGRPGASVWGEPVARRRSRARIGERRDPTLGPKRPLNRGDRADHDRRRARGAAELVCVPLIEVDRAAALEVAIARRRDLATPALCIDDGAEVREIEAGAVGTPVPTVRAGRRGAGAYDDCPRVAVAAVEWVRPVHRKAARPDTVDRVVEVLGAVAGRLDDDHALVTSRSGWRRSRPATTQSR